MIQYGDVLRVSYQVDDSFFLTGHTSKVVYKLHRSLATTGATSGACGLVALLFAIKTLFTYSYSSWPGDIDHTMLHANKYHQVFDSLRKGKTLFAAHYKETNVWMKPQDISFALSHNPVTVTNYEIDSMLLMANKIFTLKPQEVMLLFQIEEQRVWSVVNCSLSFQWMVIYSSQFHRLGDDQKYGDIIYRFRKTWLNIIHILTLVEEHSGASLQDSCHIQVFKDNI